MSRGRRDSRRARECREHLARWSASGLSVRAICAQQGVAEASLYFWKRELQSREVTKSSVAAGPGVEEYTRQKPPLFMPLTVVSDIGPTVTTATTKVCCP